MIKLSFGNTKTGKGIAIFNLPAITTCIGCTGLCASKCYARKAERMYPKVLPAREANKEQADSDDFINNMIEAVTKASKKKGFTGLFRIHESGDFYNQKYLEAWKEIASNFPQIKFLAFTKSHQLDFGKIPQNLNVVYSLFPDTSKVLENMPKAIAVKKVEKLEKNEYLCPGSCAECNLCWNLKENETVYFEFH